MIPSGGVWFPSRKDISLSSSSKILVSVTENERKFLLATIFLVRGMSQESSLSLSLSLSLYLYLSRSISLFPSFSTPFTQHPFLGSSSNFQFSREDSFCLGNTFTLESLENTTDTHRHAHALRIGVCLGMWSFLFSLSLLYLLLSFYIYFFPFFLSLFFFFLSLLPSVSLVL